MKLFNQSLQYLTISIFTIVSIWSIVFYLKLTHEIKSSIDEGLENSKRMIIQNAKKDSSILKQKYFDESYFTIQKIEKEEALNITDTYQDTTILMQDADDEELELEPVRILTSAFKINHHYYKLKVANSMVEEDDLIEELFWNVLGLYIILIIVIILINNFVLNRLWKPFYDFIRQLEHYRLGNTQKSPSIITKTKEFNDLQEAVNTLIAQNKHTFEQQKEFIGNASHELQTPLSIAINRLELLIEQDNFNERQLQDIADIYEIIQRLIQLNKSLLLLSKIENKQFFDNKETLINEIVQNNINELHEFASFKNISISLQEEQQLLVNIDPVLANIIIVNLIKNAINYNVENGSIHFSIKENELQICNTGTPNSLDTNQIFRRFYKSNAEKNGSGLGLAIIKAITDLYQYSVSYNFINKQHCFTINFSAKL